MVLTGTTYPLLAELVFGAKLSVGPPYFQATVFPLAIPLFAAMSLGPVLPWKRAELWPALIKLWWTALIAAAVGIVAALGLRYGLASLGFAAAAWLICGAFAELVERTRLFRAPFATFRARVAAQPLSVWGSAVAHAGMGVTVAGIAGMSLAASTIIAVTPGRVSALPQAHELRCSPPAAWSWSWRQHIRRGRSASGGAANNRPCTRCEAP